MSEPNLSEIRREIQAELDLHRREVGFQLNGIERWIQTASSAIDKVVELQVMINTSREAQLLDRGVNDEFRRDLKSQVETMRSEVAGVKAKTQEVAMKTTILIGAGVTLMNLGLWALQRFL